MEIALTLEKNRLKRARHEVMPSTLQPSREKPYTLSFSSADRYDMVKPHANPLVIAALISSFRIRKMLVDTGSSMDIFFWDVFQKMGIRKDRLRLVNMSLVRLVESQVTPLGTIHLTLTLGEEPKCARIDANWLVVDCETSYNAIIGRTGLTKLRVAISPHLLLLKFPTDREIAGVRGNQITAKECYVSFLCSRDPSTMDTEP